MPRGKAVGKQKGRKSRKPAGKQRKGSYDDDDAEEGRHNPQWLRALRRVQAESDVSEGIEYEPPTGADVKRAGMDEEIDEDDAMGEDAVDAALGKAVDGLWESMASAGSTSLPGGKTGFVGDFQSVNDSDIDDDALADEEGAVTVMDMLDANLARSGAVTDEATASAAPDKKSQPRSFLGLGVAGHSQSETIAGASSSSSSSGAAAAPLAGAAGAAGVATGLSVHDLMGGLTGTDGGADEEFLRSSAVASLSRAADTLARQGGPVLAPSSKPVRQRASRQVSYETTSEHVGRWEGAIRSERRSDQLNLVAEAAPIGERLRATTASLVSRFAPEDDAEAAVAAALAEAGVSDAAGIRSAEAEAAKLLAARPENAAERAKRENQLERLKAVLLRDEDRRRRQNKSKSKSYRRTKKRISKKADATERERMRREEPERAAALDEKDAVEAAKMRATLRTRSGSKWVRRVLKSGGMMGAGLGKKRSEVLEALREADELRKRVRGSDEDDGDDDTDEGASDDDESKASDNDDHQDSASRKHSNSQAHADDAAEAGLDAAGAAELLEVRRTRLAVLRDAGILGPAGRALDEDEVSDTESLTGQTGIAGMAFMVNAGRAARAESRTAARTIAISLERDEARLLGKPLPPAHGRTDGRKRHESDAAAERGGRRKFVPGQMEKETAKALAEQKTEAARSARISRALRDETRLEKAQAAVGGEDDDDDSTDDDAESSDDDDDDDEEEEDVSANQQTSDIVKTVHKRNRSDDNDKQAAQRAAESMTVAAGASGFRSSASSSSSTTTASSSSSSVSQRRSGMVRTVGGIMVKATTNTHKDDQQDSEAESDGDSESDGPSGSDSESANPWMSGSNRGTAEAKGQRGAHARSRRTGSRVRHGEASERSGGGGGGGSGSRDASSKVMDVAAALDSLHHTDTATPTTGGGGGRGVGGSARHINKAPKSKRSRHSATSTNKTTKTSDDSDSDSNDATAADDDDDDEQQEELVRRAFADGGVAAAELQSEKQSQADEEADAALLREAGLGRRARKAAMHGNKSVEEILGPTSGWGSWAGAGVKKEPKWVRDKRRDVKHRIEARRASVVKRRRDARAANTVINEKRDRKLAKHQVLPQALPVAFHGRKEAGIGPVSKGEWSTGAAAYEQSLRHPIGREWNTKAATASLTAPEVITRAGLMISPASFRAATAKKKATERDEADRGLGYLADKQRTRTKTKRAAKHAAPTTAKARGRAKALKAKAPAIR